MAFIWSRKFVKPSQVVPVEQETIQVITIQECDKISVEEHKDGERLVSSCKEDDETNESQGHLCQGQGTRSGDQGSQEDLAQHEEQHEDHEDEEGSSQPLTEELATE
jgi:hypothetical protein